MPINDNLNDRLSAFLTLHESEIAFVQRSHKDDLKGISSDSARAGLSIIIA